VLLARCSLSSDVYLMPSFYCLVMWSMTEGRRDGAVMSCCSHAGVDCDVVLNVYRCM